MVYKKIILSPIDELPLGFVGLSITFLLNNYITKYFLLTNYIIIFYNCVLMLVIDIHAYNIYLQLLLFNRTIYISNYLKKYVLNERS